MPKLWGRGGNVNINQKNFGHNNVMIGVQNNIIGGTAIINGMVIVDGVELPKPPTSCHNTTIINGKVYIDGYEFKNGKWKKTLRAWWRF